MRSLDVFFLFIFLSLSTHSLQAQLSRFSRIYSGGGSMSADNSDIRLSATPATQYFLGRKVSFGGQMQINGSFNRGLQLVVAEPELRFYFNPDHFRTQWFAFSRGHFGVYTKESEQLDIPFILSGGLGILAHLGDGLVWESTFYVSFHQEPVSSFFEYPAFFLQNRLVFFRNALTEAALPTLRSGSWMIGGSTFGAERHSLVNARSFMVYVTPSVGYFFTERLLLGLQLPFNYGSIAADLVFSPNPFRITSLNWGFVPFVRYYPGNTESRVRPFGELRNRSSYVQTATHDQLSPFPSKTSDHANFTQVGGGVDLFVSSQVALEIALFLGKNFKSNRTSGNLEIGFQYFIP